MVKVFFFLVVVGFQARHAQAWFMTKFLLTTMVKLGMVLSLVWRKIASSFIF